MSDPEISIVMGCYRREVQLQRALWSIARQPAAGRAEIVLVDNSEDRDPTLRVVREWSSRGLTFQYLHRPNRSRRWQNPCLAWNVGIQLARAPVLILTGPDILHLGDTLEPLIQPHQDGPEQAVLGCVCNLSETITRTLEERHWQEWVDRPLAELWEEWELDWGAARCHPFYRRSGAFFLGSLHTETARAIGGFDEDFQYGIGFDDDDFIRRLRLHGVEEVYDENVVGLHQWHEDFTNDPLGRFELNRYVFRRKAQEGTRVANAGRRWGALRADDFCEGVPTATPLPPKVGGDRRGGQGEVRPTRPVRLLACVVVGSDTRWLWRCLHDLQRYANAIVVLHPPGRTDLSSVTRAFSRVCAVVALPEATAGVVWFDPAPWVEEVGAEWVLLLRATEMMEDRFVVAAGNGTGSGIIGPPYGGTTNDDEEEARAYAFRSASLWLDEGHYRVDGPWYYAQPGQRQSVTRLWHYSVPHVAIVGLDYLHVRSVAAGNGTASAWRLPIADCRLPIFQTPDPGKSQIGNGKSEMASAPYPVRQTEFTLVDWHHVGSEAGNGTASASRLPIADCRLPIAGVRTPENRKSQIANRKSATASVPYRTMGLAELADVPEDWKKPPPLASVVVLTYNRLALTQECLRGLLENTRFPLELLIVDNGSTDGTPAWLQQFAQLAQDRAAIKLLLHPRNIGVARAKNEGMRLARGNCLLCVDNDIVPPPFWIERIVERLDADPRIGCCGFPTRAYRPPTWPACINDVDVEVVAFGHAVGQCYGFRRELLEERGYLCEDFGYYGPDDLDFALRMAMAGYLVVHVPGPEARNLDERTMVTGRTPGPRGPEEEAYYAFKARSVQAAGAIRERYAHEYACGRRPLVMKYEYWQPTPTDRQGWKQVSLIVLVHEPEGQTRDGLASLQRAFKDLDLQVIGVDSGTHPETTEYLHEQENLTVVPLPVDHWTFLRALNAGAGRATGDVLVFAQAGLQVAGMGWATAMAHAFATHPSLGLLVARLGEFPDEEERSVGPELRLLSGWGNGCLFALPRWMWEKLAPFDEGYTGYGCEEADLALRVRKHGGWVAELLEGRCALASTGIQTLRSRGGVEAVAVNLQHFAVVHGEPLPFDPFTSENLWGEVEAYLEQVFSQVELPALGATRPAFWETLAETERANESGTQEPVLSVILDDVVEIGEIWSCYEILNDLVTIPWELLIAGNDAQVPGLGDVRVRVLPTSESRERWQAFNAALDLAAGHYLTRWNRLWQACPTALCRAVWRLEQAPEVAAVAVVPSLRGKAASASGSAFVWRRSPHRVAGPDVAAVEYTLCCQLARTGGALEVQFAEDG